MFEGEGRGFGKGIDAMKG
jgi:hypothetical protein